MTGGKSARSTCGTRIFEMAELAQLLGRHRDLVRAAPAEHMDVADRRIAEQREGVGDDVRADELGRRLGQDAGDVERDIAVADHRRRRNVERRIEVGEFGMAVIPADERGRADHAGQVAARNLERPIGGRAGGEDHRIVEPDQFRDRDVAADQDIAAEADIVAERDLLVAAVDRLDRLVVGRDAEADQAVGHGHAVDHVDPDLVAELLLQRLGAVIAGGPRTDDRDVPHVSPALGCGGRC